MKRRPSNFIFLLLVIVASLSCQTGAAQDKDVKSIIDSRNFVFRVTHESGGDFALGNYYFYLINDSVSVALPYHGTSGTAAYTLDDNGINVHTKGFYLRVKPVKEWQLYH